jgi:ankyrin repeat domain-containing protein 50
VKQIIERHEDLVPIIAGLYMKHKKEKTKPTQQELMNLLAEFVKHGKSLFFVLDALDEMRVEDRPLLLRLLASLDAKLFITSRPLDAVQKQYPQAQMFDIAASRADVELHVKDFLLHSPEVMALIEGSDLEQNLAEAIYQKSGGM